MDERTQKIIEIKVDANQAINGIVELNKKIKEQKDRQAELQKQIKELEKAEGDHTAEIKQKEAEIVKSKEVTKTYSAEVSRLSKIVQNDLKIQKEQMGSMQQLRAQLSNLTREYDELSEAERKSAKGVELKDKINELTDALKENEEATQRYYRNVGNYENAIKNAIGMNSKFGQTMQGVAEATSKGVGPALIGIGVALKAVGTQLLKLLANPIVALLAAVAAVLIAVANGIKSSEENMAKFKAVTAAFRPILDVITRAFQGLASVILDVVGWIGKFTGGILKYLEKAPLVGDAIKKINDESARYIQLEKDKQALINRTRDLEVEASKAERDVAELRTKAKDREMYTDQQRLKFVQDANAIEKRIADEKKAIAVENLRLLKEQAEATENNKEVNDELKRAEAELYRAETEYHNKVRELLEQENTIKNEIAAKEKARTEEARKANEEKIKMQQKYNDALQEAYAETQDMLIEMLQDGVMKEEELERTRYDRQVQAIKDKQALYAEDTTLYQEYALQLELAAQQHAANMQQIGIDERLREANERALDWDNRIAEAKLKGEDYKNVTLAMLQDRLDTMYKLQGETDAEFKARQLEAQQEYLDQKKEMAEDEIALERMKVQSIASMAGSISSILEATAGDNKKRLKAAKVAALGEVMLNQGIAIAQAVKAGGEYPFPMNLLTIASSVAGAIAALVPAIQAVNSVKLARGGFVSGAGTSTSDSIPAMLSNGEFVVNARATAMFPELLTAINALGLGIAAPARAGQATQTRQAQENRDELVRALQQMPAPVVSVEEVNRVNARVRVLENVTRLT